MPRTTRSVLLALVVPLVALAAGCAGGAARLAPGTATEGGWEGLLRPRPTPLAGAPRVAVSEIRLLPEDPWSMDAAAPPALGVAELVAANLLRRRDVQFVERRRFAAAAERERLGLPRGPGAPPVGTSPGARYLLAGGWLGLGTDSATLDVRLVEAETGVTRTTLRVRTPRDVDPAGLARTVTGGLLAMLDSLAARPAGDAPLPTGYRASGVPPEAFEAFLQGVAEEDAYRWERARDAYRRALALGGAAFVEADEALARVARLHAGGTLGAS